MRRPSLISVGALVVAVSGGVLLTPASAWACKCVSFQLLAPADGQTDVPPNTKLWLVSGRGEPTPTFALAGPDGDVPISVMELGQTRDLRVMITPAQELTPGATYQLGRCVQQGAQGLPVLCEKVTRFTVGSLRAEQPPPPVERSRSEFYRDGSKGSSCGPSATRLVEFKLDWQGLLLLADIDGASPYPADPGAVLSTAISDKQYAQGGVWRWVPDRVSPPDGPAGTPRRCGSEPSTLPVSFRAGASLRP